MRRTVAAVLPCLVVMLIAGALAAPSAADEPMAGHVALAANDMQWGPVPPVFEPGAELSVVQGDPSSDGPYVLRVRAHDGYRVMPHWHPTAENVTVISGTFHFGMGDTFDDSAGTALGPGGYASLPANMHHYAWLEGDTELQIHGVGPFTLTYVDPSYDPQAAPAAETSEE